MKKEFLGSLFSYLGGPGRNRTGLRMPDPVIYPPTCSLCDWQEVKLAYSSAKEALISTGGNIL